MADIQRGRTSNYCSLVNRCCLIWFTLSYDEIARSSQAIGGLNTLPLELRGLTTTVTDPTIYALGTLTTAVSFCAIFCS